EMIRKIETEQIDQLLELLPDKGHHEMSFVHDGTAWQFHFKFNSFGAHFDTVGSGASPDLAYAEAKKVLQAQIRQWHAARQQDRPYLAPTAVTEKTAVETHKPDAARSPTVLIVEDDVD